MGKENIVLEKSYKFAISIINVYKHLIKDKKEYVLSKQLLRCGTSIGANISEANGAISKADFSNKISITYKECLEVKYWFSLLKDTYYIEKETYKDIFSKADEIGRLLFSILKSTRISNH